MQAETEPLTTEPLTLDLAPALRIRLKAIAGFKGMDMRSYCQAAIEREVAKDESEGTYKGGIDQQVLDRIVARRKELFGGRPLPGDAVDLVREARSIRNAEMDGWM